jgi:3-oxosteroid 1-dehydrogenase
MQVHKLDALHNQLYATVELWNNAPAADPILEKDRIVGLVIKKVGRKLRIRARNGVILATGGFARSAELSRK